MIKLGSGNITLYLGDKKVTAVWLGSEKVYPNSFLELSASSLSFAAAGQTQQLAITVNDGQAWTIAALPAGFSVSASSGTGPATVTVTAANNTSTTVRTGALTVNSEDLSAACSLSQTAGAKVFAAPVITDFHYTGTGMTYDNKGSYAKAAGGSFTSILTYYQDYTWNGVAGSGGRLTTGATVNCSGTGVASNGNLTMPSKGTTFSAQTLFTEVAVAISMNGKSYTGHHKVYQAANCVVKVEGIGSRNSLSYSQAPAGGGTSSPTWAGDTDAVMDTKVRTTFSSGATAGWSAAKAGGTWSIDRMPYSWSGASGNFTALNTSTGVVTVSSKGTAVSGVTNGPTVTCNLYYKFTNSASYGGSAVVAVSAVPGTATPVQAANAAKAGSTYILVNGSQATSKSLSFGNAASTQYLRLRQKQNYSYTSGATEVVDTSKKPSFASSSGYFTVKDATDYGGNPTVPEYMFGITVTANSSSSSRSATVTFTFPNGDKVTASCTQSAGGGTTTKPQYLKIMADSVTAGNSSVPSLTVAWGTTAGSYSNSETLTASNITTTGKTVSLGNMASGRTIYFKFTGQVTPVKMASIEFTGSGLTLSGDTSYRGASAVEFYGQMSVDATSKTANLNITTVQ